MVLLAGIEGDGRSKITGEMERQRSWESVAVVGPKFRGGIGP